MASADFLRFVVTAHSFFFQMRPQDLPGYSHALSLFTCRIYRKRFRAVIGLCFVMQTHPRLRPYMRFLFVRPEVCPLGDLLTPKIRLSSDSASRRTPLPLANPSHCRADSGLSPYRTCAHRAHMYQFLAPNGATGIDIQKFPCPKAFIYRGASVAHGNLIMKA